MMLGPAPLSSPLDDKLPTSRTEHTATTSFSSADGAPAKKWYRRVLKVVSFSWLVERAVPLDVPEHSALRAIFMPLYIWVGTLCVFISFQRVQAGTYMQEMDTPSLLIAIFGFYGAAVVSFATKFPTPRIAEVTMGTISLAALLYDWRQTATLSERSWSFVVVLMDLLLLADGSKTCQYALVIGVVLWHFVERSESVLRWGLYSTNYLTVSESVPIVCNCVQPPCATKDPVSGLADLGTAYAVFIGDFALTRGFAQGLRSRKAQLEAAADVVEKVTALLVRYETDEATQLVTGESGNLLPPGIRVPFLQLLGNLNRYKRYLPDAVIQQTSCSRSVGTTSSGRNDLHADDTCPPGLDIASAQSMRSETDYQPSTASLRLHTGPPELPPGPVPPEILDMLAKGVTRAARPPTVERRKRGSQRQKGVRLLPHLKSRSAAVICCRVSGLREQCARMAPALVEAVHNSFLEMVLRNARRMRGVMHSFDDGDFVLTFGAMASTSTACHDAVHCAVSITEEAPEIQSLTEEVMKHPSHTGSSFQLKGVRVAIDWDVIMTGEIGTNDRRSFGVLGPAVATVRRLCEVADQKERTLLCTQRVWDRMQSEEWVSATEVQPDIFELNVHGHMPPKPGGPLDASNRTDPMDVNQSTTVASSSGMPSVLGLSQSVVASPLSEIVACPQPQTGSPAVPRPASAFNAPPRHSP
eukprot:TRINITY_DN60596_c0_g1_i1.p1 TRINITY_DN60596_c0_g1~~TRINITY_DN60596_c0_g1_i1.p1  ORF type:complete len:698 (+),score=75.42 TRINITY_DN60596_c0_g1_i1:113-2206(+)